MNNHFRTIFEKVCGFTYEINTGFNSLQNDVWILKN